MIRSRKRSSGWWRLAALGAGGFLFQGCIADPDIFLRAGLSAGSDLAIFLLENLAVAI